MKVERIEHPRWLEWQKIPQKTKDKVFLFGDKGWVGRYQYIYRSEKGMISLVRIRTLHGWMWEIFELSEGSLLSYTGGSTEWFRTKKDAVQRIKKLLEE